MLLKLFYAIGALLLLLLGWVAVQSMARKAAERQPECGPFRVAGGGCGGCGAESSCSKPKRNDTPEH
jgi:hypothetical protein